MEPNSRTEGTPPLSFAPLLKPLYPEMAGQLRAAALAEIKRIKSDPRFMTESFDPKVAAICLQKQKEAEASEKAGESERAKELRSHVESYRTNPGFIIRVPNSEGAKRIEVCNQRIREIDAARGGIEES